LTFDLAVLGCGTAGAAVAAFAAQAGLSVVAVDRSPLAEAGARWVNGVPRWAYEVSGLGAPRKAEHRGGDQPFHLVAGWGGRRLVLEDHGVLEIDMRGLVSRLQNAARDADAVLMGNERVVAVEGDEIRLASSALRARHVVDASGLTGVGLLGGPAVAREDLCVAAQEVRGVGDRQAAEAFFARHEVPVGQTLCFTGVAGGYSIVNVALHGDELAILTGSIPALGHASGPALVERFAAEHRWVGPRLFGGSRAIPLRRPREVLARGNYARIGDAACQVFCAHGSGIGVQLVAARALADTLAADRPLHSWAVDFMRTYGGRLAASDQFARFSRSLTVEDTAGLMAAGLVPASVASAELGQREVLPRLGEVGRLALGATRQVGVLRRLAPVGLRMARLRRLHGQYPSDPADLPAWSRRVASVLGADQEVPDAR